MKHLVWLFLVLLFACKGSKESTGNKGGGKTSKKKTLVAVNMLTLRVDAFPKYDKGGEDWDAYAPFATDPDIFIKISWNENEMYKSETHNECVFGEQVVLSQSLPFELKPLDQPLLLEVFDEDGVSSNDNLGYFMFNLKDYKDWKQIVLSTPDGQLKVTMDLEWVYK